MFLWRSLTPAAIAHAAAALTRAKPAAASAPAKAPAGKAQPANVPTDPARQGIAKS